MCTEATVVLNVWTVFVPNIDLHLWSSGTLWRSSSVYPQTFEFLFIKLRWHFMLRLKFLVPQSNTRENWKVQLVEGRLSNRIIIIIIINRKTAKSKSARFLFRMCVKWDTILIDRKWKNSIFPRDRTCIMRAQSLFFNWEQKWPYHVWHLILQFKLFPECLLEVILYLYLDILFNQPWH